MYTFTNKSFVFPLIPAKWFHSRIKMETKVLLFGAFPRPHVFQANELEYSTDQEQLCRSAGDTRSPAGGIGQESEGVDVPSKKGGWIFKEENTVLVFKCLQITKHGLNQVYKPSVLSLNCVIIVDVLF